MELKPRQQVTMPLIRDILLADGPMSIHKLYLRLKVELSRRQRRIPTYQTVRISVYKLRKRGLVEVIGTEPTWREKVRLAEKKLVQVVKGMEKAGEWESFWK